MKFGYFFWLYWFLAALLLEMTSRSVIGEGMISLFSNLASKRENILPAIFLFGVCGLIGLIFISARSHEVYMAIYGKPETYVFLGDRLTEGFYGYLVNDPKQSEVFLPSFLDSNVYPATSFDALFRKIIVMRSPAGEVIKFQFYHTGNLILWSCLHLATLLFAFIGLLHMFKAAAHLDDFAQTITLVNARTGNGLMIGVIVVILMYASSVVAIRLATRDIKVDTRPVAKLPATVRSGAILEGKVIAAENYTVKSSTEKRPSSRWYRRYTIVFDERSGFDIPVYLNWGEKKIFPDTMVNTSRSLKVELKMRQEYYGDAFEKLDAAKNDGTYFPFMVNKDFTLIPYLEQKKGMINSLLAIKRR